MFYILLGGCALFLWLHTQIPPYKRTKTTYANSWAFIVAALLWAGAAVLGVQAIVEDAHKLRRAIPVDNGMPGPDLRHEMSHTMHIEVQSDPSGAAIYCISVLDWEDRLGLDYTDWSNEGWESLSDLEREPFLCVEGRTPCTILAYGGQTRYVIATYYAGEWAFARLMAFRTMPNKVHLYYYEPGPRPHR